MLDVLSLLLIANVGTLNEGTTMQLVPIFLRFDQGALILARRW
jgi:hypothetical protein